MYANLPLSTFGGIEEVILQLHYTEDKVKPGRLVPSNRLYYIQALAAFLGFGGFYKENREAQIL